MYDIQLIKSRISCVDIAQRCGLPIRQSGDRCVSPLRSGASNPSSFCVDDDFFYDFGSGSGGDVIDLLAELRFSGDRGAAIRELARLTGVAPTDQDDTAGWLEYTKQLNAQTAYYHSQLTDDDRAYLHSRGLRDDDISRLMIGRVTDGPLRGRLFLPYFNSGYVSYYATRALPGGAFPENKYMKQRRDNHCKHIPWGLQTLTRNQETLVIAEGYFDAAAFEVTGYPVLSAITGRFSRDQIPIVLAAARKFKRVFIVYDNDPGSHAGESFAQSMSELLTRSRIPFVVGTVPTPWHDISEYYAAGGDLARIIDSAEPGVQYIASRLPSFDELEKFMYTVARYTKRTQLENLFTQLKRLTDYDPKRLDSLFKSCVTAPPETIVADEILRDHQLISVPSVGFYEYTGGVWTRQPDEIIQTYADRAYGEFSTYQRVKSLVGLLRTRATKSVVFNQQPVWNFINGTLELDSGVFRDHNPNDYCSFQADYPYNPDATYAAWTRFIDDVTAGDPKTAELLQFIPAYVLMPHTNYEKIFVLSGAGGNGKSKYLEILRELFGASNVTHITPRGLLDRFQRIALKDSLVNIAGEIKSDLRDSEEYMKMIASGEPISACYKSQNFIDFTPRTKLVFATNAQLASGDTSEGLTRRLVLVDFKVSFVDYPDQNDPYQRLKDPEIIEKLRGELQSGGVFNWAYEGYKLLKTVGYFTETNDQAELITEFKRASNPVLLFYEDCHSNLPAEISNSSLYSQYRQWCVDNGYLAKASNSFHREFKNVSKNDYQPYRTAAERGYRRRL